MLTNGAAGGDTLLLEGIQLDHSHFSTDYVCSFCSIDSYCQTSNVVLDVECDNSGECTLSCVTPNWGVHHIASNTTLTLVDGNDNTIPNANGVNVTVEFFGYI